MWWQCAPLKSTEKKKKNIKTQHQVQSVLKAVCDGGKMKVGEAKGSTIPQIPSHPPGGTISIPFNRLTLSKHRSEAKLPLSADVGRSLSSRPLL